MIALYKKCIEEFLLLIKTPTIWKYILPAFIVALIFFGIKAFFGSLTAQLLDSERSLLALIGKGLTASASIGSNFLNLLQQFIILTLFSPFNSLLSEKIDEILYKKKFPYSLLQLIKDVIRAIGVVCISGLIYLLVLIFWSIISRIIGVQPINPLLFFLLSSILLGFSFFDYSLERHRFSIKKSYVFGSKNFIHLLIVGLIFNLIFITPIIGIVLAPFVATIISTIIYLNVAKMPPTNLNKSIQDEESF